MTGVEASAEGLSIRRLEVSLGRPPKPILHDVTLDVGRGEVVALIGETGSGKSTIARAVLGLVPVAGGSIAADGVALERLRGGALRRHRRSGAVQYVFQDPLRSLDPDFAVSRSVLEGVDRSLGRARREEILDRTLDRVGLDRSLAGRLPSELSGGQRQRVAIARSLAVSPSVLLCDEPVSALDAASRIEVLDLIRAITSEERVATLLITHDLGSLIDVADRVAVLLHGRIVEVGATSDVLTRPRHDYTRLLLASVPPLHSDARPASERRELRARVEALSAGER